MQIRLFFLLCILTTVLTFTVVIQNDPQAGCDTGSIVANGNHRLAAKELRRYLYEVTGSLWQWTTATPSSGSVIHLITKNDVASMKKYFPEKLHSDVNSLKEQEYMIVTDDDRAILVGGSDLGLLYSVYTFCETLGVRFYTHGTVVPDRTALSSPIHVTLPQLLKDSPSFDIRGLHPFHDFPEGPDWWNINEYKLHLTQMLKMKMNFIGLHTYPLYEPTVWVGTPTQFHANGTVIQSYQSSYSTTLRGDWGYQAKNTSDYMFGNSVLFPYDCFGSKVMIDACPLPLTNETYNMVFDRAGMLLQEAFVYANSIGIQTCAGTETPLDKPDPSIDTITYYEGIFSRIKDTYPLDYYWIWTPEDWEWGMVNVSNPVVAQALLDMKYALNAVQNVGNPFGLAMCGWEIGPLPNRTYFDKVLPSPFVMSSLDRNVGWDPVDPAYAEIVNHQKWVIPWMEDDPGLTAPQLWVNRTLDHGLDAMKYSISGLIGILWRTVETEPQVNAMAQFSWNPEFTSEQFWIQYTNVNFGSTVAEEAAAIFQLVDSFGMPRPVTWTDGPGGVVPNPIPWSQQIANYTWVDDFADLEDMVQGTSNLWRFRQWKNRFNYMKSLAQLLCTWNVYNEEMAKVLSIDPVSGHEQRRQLAMEIVLPVRMDIVLQATEAMLFLQSTISSTGTLGTIMNLEQHDFPQIIDDPGSELRSIFNYIGCFVDNKTRDLDGFSFESSDMTPGYCLQLCTSNGPYKYAGVQYGSWCFCGNKYGKYGKVSASECNMNCSGQSAFECGSAWRNSIYDNTVPLPKGASPSPSYEGPPHLIVPTARSLLEANETFTIDAMVLSVAEPRDLIINVKPLGVEAPFTAFPFHLVTQGRSVYHVKLPLDVTMEDFEFYIQAGVGSKVLYFPAAAPEGIYHTVIVL